MSFHPWLDRGAFWRDHMKHTRSEIECSKEQDVPLLEELPKHVRFPVSFAGGEGDQLLESGWSYAESWGVWSDGSESTLTFNVDADQANRLETVALHFHLYYGPSVSDQSIQVFVNDNHVETWDFDDNKGGTSCCRRAITMPSDLNEGKVTISLSYDSVRDPSAKGESGDPRRLALGLEETEWLKNQK